MGYCNGGDIGGSNKVIKKMRADDTTSDTEN